MTTESLQSNRNKLKKGFVNLRETWYFDALPHIFPSDYINCILVGIYTEENHPIKELKIVWRERDIYIESKRDTWTLFEDLPELITYMVSIDHQDKHPTMEEFLKELKALGYADCTEYSIDKAK